MPRQPRLPAQTRRNYLSTAVVLADRIKGSKLHNLKELRPPATNVRILFIFDPQRQAVLLAAGDKTGQWAKWYTDNIPKAERRYQDWLDATPTRQEE